jgi:hypothetical protein
LRQAFPVRCLTGQFAAAQTRQRVELRAPPDLAGVPFRRYPALLLQLVERWIARSIANLQNIGGDLFEPLADGESVERLQSQDLKKEGFQGTLN